jgi:nanoRNase/pAp phosphatase (c-di-AMP/oligoRNAs hydrolase)
MNRNYKELSSRLISSLKKYHNILIFIKGSPDPDVIASSFAVKVVCDALGIKSSIVALMEPSLPQNRAIIDELHIPVSVEKSLGDISRYDAYAVVDHQSPAAEGLSGRLPCAVHIDHHEAVDSGIRADFEVISDAAGAAGTIMALLLRECGLEIDETVMRRLATALHYGIQTDTDRFIHAGRLDYNALEYISRYYDADFIKKINGLPLSEGMARLFGAATDNSLIYKDWLITGIGFLEEKRRDSIAIIADSLLQREDVHVVVVFAAVRMENGGLMLDASLRAKKEGVNLDAIIKRITRDGGARKFKGAYQVHMDYFAGFPQKELLWEVIQSATVDILKRQRDSIHIIELKSSFEKAKKRISDFFSNFSSPRTEG